MGLNKSDLITKKNSKIVNMHAVIYMSLKVVVSRWSHGLSTLLVISWLVQKQKQFHAGANDDWINSLDISQHSTTAQPESSRELPNAPSGPPLRHFIILSIPPK